jgi:hypothetical protein
MKKYPTCGDEIQDADRFCPYSEWKLETPSPALITNLAPAWQQGAKAAFVISACFVVGLLSGNISMTRAELAGSFIMGLIATFLVWWTACTIIVGFWRVVTHNT